MPLFLETHIAGLTNDVSKTSDMRFPQNTDEMRKGACLYEKRRFGMPRKWNEVVQGERRGMPKWGI